MIAIWRTPISHSTLNNKCNTIWVDAFHIHCTLHHDNVLCTHSQLWGNSSYTVTYHFTCWFSTWDIPYRLELKSVRLAIRCEDASKEWKYLQVWDLQGIYTTCSGRQLYPQASMIQHSQVIQTKLCLWLDPPEVSILCVVSRQRRTCISEVNGQNCNYD